MAHQPQGGILVTGASGLVGRALLPLLLSAGNTVRGSVRRPTHLAAGVENCIVGDIGPVTDWDAALTGVEGVVHLMAPVYVMHDNEPDPLAAFRLVNVGGTEHLGRSAAAARFQRFIYLSSVKVNGQATPGVPAMGTDATCAGTSTA
jgi:nucleoside-diphosphate-sugar epimerase